MLVTLGRRNAPAVAGGCYETGGACRIRYGLIWTVAEAEGANRPIVQVQPHVPMEIRAFHEIFWSNSGRKYSCQQRRVLSAHPKRNDGPDVAEHSGQRALPAVGAPQLGRVLRSQHQAQGVLAGLCQ